MDTLSRCDEKTFLENDHEVEQASRQRVHCEFGKALLLRYFLFPKNGTHPNEVPIAQGMLSIAKASELLV